MNDIDLWIDDVPTLTGGVRTDSGFVIDDVMGDSLALGGVAEDLVKNMDGRSTVGDLAEALETIYGISRSQAMADVSDFLEDMDSRALLRWQTKKQFSVERLRARCIEWAMGSSRAPLARRYSNSYQALLKAVVRANGGSLAAGAALSLLLTQTLWSQGVLDGGGLGKVLLGAVPLTLMVTIVAGFYFHEAGHLMVMRIGSPTRAGFVVRRGTRVSIAHVGLPAQWGRRVAVSGVAAGLGFHAAIALCTLFSGLGFLSVLVAVSGLLHLYSLMPWTADGRMIWRGMEA